MHLNWIDVSDLSFNTLLLLERVQLSWFPGWVPEDVLSIALHGNPAVEWYLRHKCPEINEWLDEVISAHTSASPLSPNRIRQAELEVMNTINDLIVYVVDPTLYDARPFLSWDSNELRQITDFTGKVVIDIGSGTGRLAFVAAEAAAVVFAVEPVDNLRRYIKQKARQRNITNVYPIDGIITDLPFPDAFVDVTMGGHVYGAHPAEEYAEMKRVTRPGGMLILCPGTGMEENEAHAYLISQDFDCQEFDEIEGMKRKYWKQV